MEDQPSVNIAETPEFKAAVEAATAQAVTAALATLKGAAAPSDGGDLSKLAHALAEITNQGSGKVIVDPLEMKRRAEAEARMLKHIEDAAAAGEDPHYRVIDTVYLVDQIIQPYVQGPGGKPIPQKISWSGPPSLALKPLNAWAQKIHSSFLDSIGQKEVVDAPKLFMTGKGLLIHSVASETLRTHRALDNSDDEIIPASRGVAGRDDDDISGNSDPRNKTRHVLGTIADPALSLDQADAKYKN